MSTPNNPKDDDVPEKVLQNETGSQQEQQQQPQPQEPPPPPSDCMDVKTDTGKESPSTVSLNSLPSTPPLPAVENNMEIPQTTPKQPSRLDQLLEQFLAYESSLSMTDYIKRFYQIRLEQEALRNDPEFSAKCASESVHVMRNRYRDILPYDRNRVALSQSDDNSNGYINASFISLTKGRMRFIAAQAPLPATLEEWWKMVDEQKVVLIVMLCKLVEMNKVKCERYWPAEIGQSLLFGCYEITLDEVETYPDDEYLLRRLRMTNQKTGESRVIHQLHYKEWPDHGCPSGESQLINMIEKMAELHEKTDAPVLVHCSAGVGRTGTIISVNYIRELIKSAELESLDLFDLVMSLRKQRASMVQTQDQYQFVHKCVAYYCRRHLGLPQPEPPQDDFDDSFSAPSPMAPTFNRPLQTNGDQLIQIDDSDDESESGNSVPDFPHEPPAPRGPEELGSAAS